MQPLEVPKNRKPRIFPSHCQQVSKRQNMRRAQLQNHSLWYDRSKLHALFALQIISSSFPESKSRKDTSNSQAEAPQSMLQGVSKLVELAPKFWCCRRDPSLSAVSVSAWARLAQLLSEWFTGQPRSGTALSATGTSTGQMLRKH